MVIAVTFSIQIKQGWPKFGRNFFDSTELAEVWMCACLCMDGWVALKRGTSRESRVTCIKIGDCFLSWITIELHIFDEWKVETWESQQAEGILLISQQVETFIPCCTFPVVEQPCIMHCVPLIYKSSWVCSNYHNSPTLAPRSIVWADMLLLHGTYVETFLHKPNLCPIKVDILPYPYIHILFTSSYTSQLFWQTSFLYCYSSMSI
jgi:hypothetical protein